MHMGSVYPSDCRETTSEGEEPLTACESCRKRKLKCTRQRPSCANCNRLGTQCVYEYKKIRPGLKSGAVESLNRRLEIVERALFVGAHDVQRSTAASSSAPVLDRSGQSGLLDTLATLSHELKDLNSNISSTLPLQGVASRKRKRNERTRESHHSKSSEATSTSQWTFDDLSSCPIVTDNIDGLLQAYFSHVQPWIPMIHEDTFRKRIKTAEGRHSQAVVLQAMNVAALRFVRTAVGQPLPGSYVAAEANKSRRHVILYGMGRLSVENLQALIIVAFTDLGNGDSDSAWPIIASLTRAVEYMQLSVEPTDRHTRVAFLRSISPPLLPSVEWVVEEERRRVFWNVFILDRFCSVLTGWNTSLTAADASRRLPVCGGHWRNAQPASTAYFGIWDLSSANIGRSISCLPSHYPNPPSHTASLSRQSPAAEPLGSTRPCLPSPISLSDVGGFAYYVESVESLSRVTSHFLHQRVDFKDRTQLSDWLTRFKELDLRLVLWKMYIPRHWKDSGVSREAKPGAMDPNLTVANASHNVSMILLHYQIAYPGPELIGIQLPSAHSAETIQTAAIENGTIIRRFLVGWPRDRPVRPQLGFCAYVSARALLVHWRYYNSELVPEFWSLVQSLEEMSHRWTATSPNLSSFHPGSIFLQFALQLRNTYEKCGIDVNYHVTMAGTPGAGLTDDENASQDEIDDRTANNDVPIIDVSVTSGIEQNLSTSDGSHTLISVGSTAVGDPSALPCDQLGGDDVITMSQVLMDPCFIDMDRVISFNDMVFADDIDGLFDESISEWAS